MLTHADVGSSKVFACDRQSVYPEEYDDEEKRRKTKTADQKGGLAIISSI